MSKLFHYFLVISLVMWMGGCSSSQKSGEGAGDEGQATAADAGTDAVPQEHAENADPSDPPPPGPAEAKKDGSGDSSNTASTAAADTKTPPAGATSDPAKPDPAMASNTTGTTESSASSGKSNAEGEDPAKAATSSSANASDSSTKAEATTASSAAMGGGGTGTRAIQKGDTLMKIAFEVYGDLFKWKELYEANKDKIKNPNDLPVGVELTYEKPAQEVRVSQEGEKYTIKKGDTLGSIAQDVYGTKKKWKKIWKNNQELIKDPNKIFAGFSLYYSMSPEDKEEKEKLNSTTPAPLAAAPVVNPDSNLGQPTMSNNRMPASIPATGAPPTNAPAVTGQAPQGSGNAAAMPVDPAGTNPAGPTTTH